MNEYSWTDARLEEIEYLTELDRTPGWSQVSNLHQDTPQRRMLAYLLYNEFINDISSTPWDYSRPTVETIEGRYRRLRDDALGKLLSGQVVSIALAHKGRVRLAELRDALVSARGREPMGILWSRRHLETDLRVALMTASSTAPVSLAWFDMNGLKEINDSANGHDAGDAAIRAYLQAVANNIASIGDGYRGDGGDEVAVILARTNLQAALTVIRSILKELAGAAGPGFATLTASCGVLATSAIAPPIEIIKRVDALCYAAKSASRRTDCRISAIAAEGLTVEELAPSLGESV